MRLPSTFDEMPAMTAGGVRLRAPREDDVPAIVRMFNDEQVTRYMPIPAGFSAETGQKFVDWVPYAWRELNHVAFVVADAATDACIGEAELLALHPVYETAEVALLMDVPARRLRISAAALRLICRFGFEQLGLQRIEAVCDVENRAVHGLGLYVGFRHEGMARGKYPGPNGTRRDAVTAALLPGDLTP